MTTRDEQRESALELLSDHLLRKGLAETSLRDLARATGISDRMLLYYFRDKTDLLSATLERITIQLAEQLAVAIPEEPQLSPARLMALAAQVTLSDGVRPYMRLWVEIVAAAARGEAPYVDIASQIAAGFLKWIETRLALADRAAAAAVLATVDGLALLEICSGRDRAADAAQAMIELTGSRR